jgi:hypothetical protein
MAAIHLVERENLLKRIPDAEHEWESGYWVIAPKTARALIGADLYLHSAQAKASHFGGKILDFRVEAGGERDGRIVFRFKATPGHRGVNTSSDKWSQEMKIDI